MTGGHKQILGVHKNFNTLNPRVWTKKQRSLSRNSTKSGVKTKKKVFISKYARIFTNSGVKTSKKNPLYLKKCANFHEFRSETTKKGLYHKICEKTVLAHEFWVITSILGVSGLELHSSGTKPVTFFAEQSLLGGHNSHLGGH